MILRAGDDALLVLSAETVSNEALSLLRRLGAEEPLLVITARRAESLGMKREGADAEAPVALKLLPALLFWPLLLLLFIAGIRICDVASKQVGQHDPGGIVWDEMVAYWLAAAFVPLHWAWLLAAFVLFRVFDIFKPWPIGWVEKRFGGGLGIMLDDIVAAVYAMAILYLAGQLLQSM